MKAIIQNTYGSPDDVLELRDIDKPVVKEGDVLVRILASSVNVADWIFLTGRPDIIRLAGGLLRPRHKILGRDVAGRVEAVGRTVKQLRPGDEVFGEINFGAYAEYVSVSEDVLVPKPANLTFDQAAAVPLAGLTALQGLRDTGRIQPGHKVLINGASGGVGTFALQIAKSYGAEVTGECGTRNVEMVRSIGADQVIDYSQEDFTQCGRRYDLIFDLVASHSLSDCRRVLTPKGLYVSSAGRLTWLIKVSLASLISKQIVVMPTAKNNKKDLTVLKELIEAGTIAPVIERSYGLSDVPTALRHQGEGHAQGKKVIVIV